MARRLKIAVYDLYWTTYGGGEQVDGTIAQVLAGDHDVTVLGPTRPDVAVTAERLGVDLSSCDYQRVTDDAEASEASADYDVFVNGTYLSTALNRAPLGYYYVHFPGLVRTRADAVRSRLGVAGVKALSLPPRLPQRLREVQAAFDRRVQRVEYLPSYTRYLANSRYTAEWVHKILGVDADILYPPVRTSVAPGAKQPLILALGRFFDPRYGHSKKQREMLATFAELHERQVLPGWRLALVGGCEPSSRDYALEVRRAAIGLPVDVHVNAPGSTVESLLSEASIFWHASGHGEDLERHPERAEHFGIAVIEAMAAGAVPVVVDRAGPAEIVRDGVDGRTWATLDELGSITVDLAHDEAERARLSAAAIARAAEFSVPVFTERLLALLAADAESATSGR